MKMIAPYFYGAEVACERECSRGEDYRLIKLTISDYSVRHTSPIYHVIYFIILSLPVVLIPNKHLKYRATKKRSSLWSAEVMTLLDSVALTMPMGKCIFT